MTDIRLEKMVAVVLRTGVLIAAVVVLGGGLCFLIQHGSDAPGDRTFHGVAAVYRNPREILTAAAGGDCLGIVQLGSVAVDRDAGSACRAGAGRLCVGAGPDLYDGDCDRTGDFAGQFDRERSSVVDRKCRARRAGLSRAGLQSRSPTEPG